MKREKCRGVIRSGRLESGNGENVTESSSGQSAEAFRSTRGRRARADDKAEGERADNNIYLLGRIGNFERR